MNSAIGRSRRGGWVGILLVLVLAVGIIFLLYFASGPGGQKSYVRTVIDSKEHAKKTTDMVNLVSVYKSLQVHAALNDGKYPATEEELVRATGLPSDYLFLPDKPLEPYACIYLPGQDESMPKSNVLIYEAEMRPDGTSQVLRLGGQVELLPYEQVQAAIDQTKDHLK